MNKNITEFDYNKIYNEEIAPLFNELKSRCQQYGIPFFSVCCTSNKDGVTEYKNTGLLDGALDINLYDDKFSKFLAICAGFNVISPGYERNLSEAEADYIDDASLDNTKEEDEELKKLINEA